jgi:hypothetical protein
MHYFHNKKYFYYEHGTKKQIVIIIIFLLVNQCKECFTKQLFNKYLTYNDSLKQR